MTALDKLIEAVEAGVVGVDECAAAFPSESAYGVCTWHHAWDALNGSLDAALALHEALLPEMHATISTAGDVIILHNVSTNGVSWTEAADAEIDEKPARAWLIAILRAYRSVQA